MNPGYFSRRMVRGKCVVEFWRTGTRRVLIKRGINSSEINASLCFFGRVERQDEKKKTRRRNYEKKTEKNEQERGKGNGLLVSSIHNGRVISRNPKKRPNIAGFLQFEKTILFRKSRDEKRSHEESLNRYSCSLDKT